MRVFVQFPEQAAMVKLTVAPPTFDGLLQGVAQHRHAQGRPVKRLWYSYLMPDSTRHPVEIDDETFGDITPETDIINVVIETATTSPPNSDACTERAPVPPIVPKLNINQEQLSRFKSCPSSGKPTHGAITDADTALAFLETSKGYMEAIKVPRFLRSINCQQSMEDVWARLRVSMTKEGYVSHAEVAALIRDDPVVGTPRTTFTARDMLPLGASAVSPLPAGKNINDLIASLDKMSSAGSNATFKTVSNGTQQPPFKVPDLRTHLLNILDGTQSDTVAQDTLPSVLRTLNIRSDSETVERTLSSLRINKGRRLTRHDLCKVLSKIQAIPKDDVVPHLRTHLKRSSVLSSSLPKRSLNGMTDSLSSDGQPSPCGCCGREVAISAKVVCGGCKTAFYCSNECLNRDWQGHQPICDAVSAHHSVKKLTVRAVSGGTVFTVLACPTTDAATRYMLVVTQRVPVVRKTFLLFSTVHGVCEYSYPPADPPPEESAVHSLIRDIYMSVYEAALERGVWVLAACCLGPLRSYRCKESDFTSLIADYKRYHAAFLAQACQQQVCETVLKYDLVVPFMETLCESFESRALQVQSEAKQFVQEVTQAKNYYLSLLVYLQETAFCKEVEGRAERDRQEVMRKVSVVYQHLAARDREGKALTYLERSEAVLLRLTSEHPTPVNYNLLGLLYDCLPHNTTYQRKAEMARKKAAELIHTSITPQPSPEESPPPDIEPV